MTKIKPSLPTRARRILASLCVAVAVFGPVALAGSAGAATITPVNVLGSGSDVAYPVMSALDQLYNESPGCTVIAPTGTQPLNNELHPAVDRHQDRKLRPQPAFSETYPIGGSAGHHPALRAGPERRRQDQLRAPDVGSQLVVVHRSALRRLCPRRHHLGSVPCRVWFGARRPSSNQSGACSGARPGCCLTQAQLQGIYVNCTITNWDQVGGSGMSPIVAYSILPQYGTRKAFDTFLGGWSSTSCRVKLIEQTDNASRAADRPRHRPGRRSASGTSATRVHRGGRGWARSTVSRRPRTSCRARSPTGGSSTTSTAQGPAKANKCGTATQSGTP